MLPPLTLQQLEHAWRRWFSIEELERSPALQWSYGAILFFFFLTFSYWIGNSAITAETAARGMGVCWPYFQDCTSLYFLQALPDGYSQSVFYMALYAAMTYIVLLMWRGSWALAHILLSLLLIWKLFVMFGLSYIIAGPYDYYHVAFTIILLFLPFKEYFLKLTIVILYFLSGTTKFDSTWILGTYFTTLQTGLPLFPDALTPLFTNFVVFMQVVGAWFLLSRNSALRYGTLAFFVAFHLYSGILVYYHYPSASLPLLIILFYMYYRPERPPLNKRAVAGWAFIALIFFFQLPPLLIAGDRRMTLEGNRYGMFMFEANHQCVATVRAHLTEGGDFPIPPQRPGCSGQICLVSSEDSIENGAGVREMRYETGAAWNRCDPYEYYIRIKQQCEKNLHLGRISLVLDHSINGGPFYRIVDEQNVCELTYQPFSHNEWIKLPGEAPAVGLPLKDEYQY